MKVNTNKYTIEKAEAMIRAMDATFNKNEEICKKIQVQAEIVTNDRIETAKISTRAVSIMAIILTASLFLNAAICTLVTYLAQR